MSLQSSSPPTALACRLLLLAPVPPPYGGMALQAKQLAEQLRADGAIVELLPSNPQLPRGLLVVERTPALRTVLRSLVLWARLWLALGRADVLHIFAASWLYFFLVVYPAVVLARLRRRRIVLNYRGGEARQFFDRYGWLARPVFRLSDLVTTPSRFLAEIIGQYFDVPVQIVPNLVNTSMFQFRSRNRFQPKMILTRHLEPIYDVETAIRAFRAIQQRYPEASLWIAGEGSQRATLERLTREWKLENVTFLGHIAHKNLPELYNQCDILLNTSRVDNFPGSLIEASAAGLVVITTAAGGIPFIYEHDHSALLFRPGDWKGLAEAVSLVVENPQLGMRLTQQALALVKQCEWKEVRKLLYQSYAANGNLSNTLEPTCIAG